MRYCRPQVVRIDTKLLAQDRVGDSSDGFDFCRDFYDERKLGPLTATV